MSADRTEWELPSIVGALCAANTPLTSDGHARRARSQIPSHAEIANIVQGLRAALFPWHFGAPDVSVQGFEYYVGRTLDAVLTALREQVYLGFAFGGDRGPEWDQQRYASEADRVTRAFAARLPAIRELLGGDARAAYEGDPAATSVDETIFSYAGMTAITHHRIAHELYALHVPLIPRIISELAHELTGIDIHPGASIGGRFFIDHGTGVVIGETSVIGEHVRLYQGVTLGAKSFPTDAAGNPVKGVPRHPIVEDDVVIYAGATVLGRITIGRGASIGGNVWLTHDVAPGRHVTQAAARYDAFDHGGGI
ncbi:MAG TPA: serine O-acetyltransferase EpsC [Polyangiaceae bacterium]|nr:serine O-acetyltransferase EpsC [Polyangiaceae bacterium]